MWRFMAARATGTSHVRHDIPCQDRFAALVADGWFVGVVADGAGSAAQSELGAEIITKHCLEHCEAGLSAGSNPQTVVRDAMLAARDAIIAEAELRCAPLRDFAATALVTIMGKDGGAAAQIGDGLIAIQEIGDDWSWVFWPQKGEYANVTRFLVDDDAPSRIEVAELRCGITGIALMTDGLEPLALHYESRTVHSPFFEGFARPLRSSALPDGPVKLSAQLEAFLISDKVTARADDDLTLVLATFVVPENDPQTC